MEMTAVLVLLFEWEGTVACLRPPEKMFGNGISFDNSVFVTVTVCRWSEWRAAMVLVVVLRTVCLSGNESAVLLSLLYLWSVVDRQSQEANVLLVRFGSLCSKCWCRVSWTTGKRTFEWEIDGFLRCWLLLVGSTVNNNADSMFVGLLLVGAMGNNSADSLLVREQKCCLVEVVVGQGDRQQQYYL